MNKLIGEYEFGYQRVNVAVTDKWGACFYLLPEKGGLPRIEVGLGSKDFSETVACITHEVIELLFSMKGLRYMPSPTVVHATDTFVFHCDHNQFSSVIADFADGAEKVLADLKKEHVAFHKKSR